MAKKGKKTTPTIVEVGTLTPGAKFSIDEKIHIFIAAYPDGITAVSPDLPPERRLVEKLSPDKLVTLLSPQPKPEPEPEPEPVPEPAPEPEPEAAETTEEPAAEETEEPSTETSEEQP